MLDVKRRLLLCEIEMQCGFALKGYSAATVALKSLDSGEFWNSVQALLAAAAHVHRFLVADEALRTALRVADSSSLMRPELDPVDDIAGSLSGWMSQHTRGPLRLSNFGPAGVSDAPREVFARYIDLDNSVVILFGRSYDIARLISAVADLVGAAKAELKSTQNVM